MVRLALLILPLSLDNFAISTVVGVTPMPRRALVRLAATFAAAEGLMPAVGLLLGLPLGSAIGEAGTYVAGALIIATGAWFWLKEWREDDADGDDEDDEKGGGDEAGQIARASRASGWALAGIALSVSLDELAVGFSFGVLRVPVAPALIAIAAQALVVSLLGQWVGQRLGARIGEGAERLAGPALCLLGVWLVVAQVAGWPV